MPATLQPPSQQEPLDNTMGAMGIGVIVSAVLFGISVVQTLYYYTRFSRDRLILRIMVAVVVSLDFVHLICISHTIYYYLISNYYNHGALTDLVWSVLIESLPTGMTALIVQSFYAERIYRLGNKNPIIPAIVLLLALATTASGTAWLILAFTGKTYERLLQISGLTITINALSMFNDALIACCLCLLLLRSKTGFHSTDRVINQLIALVVNTGVLTSLCAIGALVSLAVFPQTLIYAPFYFCIGRLYTNSFLATLNSRGVISTANRPKDKERVDMVTFTADFTSVPPEWNSQANFSTIDTVSEQKCTHDAPGMV